MSRTTWVEVCCDGCDCAEHFLAPITNESLARDHDYLVLGKNHFCSEACHKKWIERKGMC